MIKLFPEDIIFKTYQHVMFIKSVGQSGLGD